MTSTIIHVTALAYYLILTTANIEITKINDSNLTCHRICICWSNMKGYINTNKVFILPFIAQYIVGKNVIISKYHMGKGVRVHLIVDVHKHNDIL